MDERQVHALGSMGVGSSVLVRNFTDRSNIIQSHGRISGGLREDHLRFGTNCHPHVFRIGKIHEGRLDTEVRKHNTSRAVSSLIAIVSEDNMIPGLQKSSPPM